VLRRLLAAAQMPEDVVDVRELLLEIALEGLQPLDQLLAARERPPEVAASAAGAVARTVIEPVVVHQFTSFPRS
jgi:hypothetical protein